jgi:hypothetical protein
MRVLLSVIFLFFLSPSKATAITELFADGVFGTQWGDTLEAVANKLPNTNKESIGDIVWLELKDSKEVLGVPRENQELYFSFDAENRLNGVAVYYNSDDYGVLLNKLNTLFGEYTQVEGNKTALQWKSSDFVLTLSFVTIGINTNSVFSIGYHGLTKPNAKKEDLGFN